ncbi:MAG: hypothetical protein ACRDZ4_14035 [Egibacteraceae bacterium]
MSRILLVVAAAALAVAKAIFEQEYDYWAPRLAPRIIRVASLLLPAPMRDRYHNEWIAELDQAVTEGRPLSFALLEVLRASLVLTVQWRVRALVRVLKYAMATGLGAGLSVGLGGLLGGLHGAVLAVGLTAAGLDQERSALIGALLVVGLTVWLTARWSHELPAVFRLTGLNGGSATLGVGLGIGMAVGMATGLGGGLSYGQVYGPIPGMTLGMATGLSAGLVYSLFVGAFVMVLTVLTQGLGSRRAYMPGTTADADAETPVSPIVPAR